MREIGEQQKKVVVIRLFWVCLPHILLLPNTSNNLCLISAGGGALGKSNININDEQSDSLDFADEEVGVTGLGVPRISRSLSLISIIVAVR